MDSKIRVCVVKYTEIKLTETFIWTHLERLPIEAEGVHGTPPRRLTQSPIEAISFYERALQAVLRRLGLERRSNVHERDYTSAYQTLFSGIQPDVVLAEYGTTGIRVMEACERMGVPLVVHFHGYDASRQSVLEKYGEQYKTLFQKASAIIAVSREMRTALVGLGAPSEKVFHNPCGVDLDKFIQTEPQKNPAVFFAGGRLVEKKAPHLLIQAFAQVHEACPEARLRIVGGGELEGVCRDLVAAQGLQEAVTLLGTQPHETVQEEMQKARAFVQHSVVAHDGDSEGTPVSIQEAGASGLPIVSTRHAGIPDVIVEGKTGFLVDERDVQGMAQQMITLAEDPKRAAKMGKANLERVEKHFCAGRRLERMAAIIKGAVGHRSSPSTTLELAEVQAG